MCEGDCPKKGDSRTTPLLESVIKPYAKLVLLLLFQRKQRLYSFKSEWNPDRLSSTLRSGSINIIFDESERALKARSTVVVCFSPNPQSESDTGFSYSS